MTPREPHGQSGEVVIEEVTDLDAVWPSLAALFRELDEYHHEIGGPGLLPDWEERWRRKLQAPAQSLILVARRSRRAVAFLNARIQEADLLAESFGYISNVFVRPGERDEGLGRALLQRAESWCRGKGADEVRLSVVAANKPGVRFWTYAGYSLHSMTMKKRLSGGPP